MNIFKRTVGKSRELDVELKDKKRLDFVVGNLPEAQRKIMEEKVSFYGADCVLKILDRV